MPSQISAVDDVVNTAHSLVDEIENAFKELEMSDKIPTLREAEQSFVKALLAYRNSVLQEVIAHAIKQGLDYPRKSGPTFHAQLRTWQEEVDWRQFYDFMSTRAQELPYPSHLYRAHTYGYPIPRFRDEITEEFCDSFGSDMHTIAEEEGQGEIYVSMSTPRESLGTINGLVEEIAHHLKKTQINSNRTRRGEEIYSSQMVSLSGDLLWTMHTACQRDQMADEDQVAGLAIFQTSKIKESGVQLWRVKDLLEFFDGNPRFQSSKIDSVVRTWAGNADEYLCWDLVPREALINFVPVKHLAQRGDDLEDVFLRSVFLTSKTLGVFRRLAYPLEKLTVDRYRNRISSFMMGIMDHVAFDVDTDAFVDTMVKCFRDPSQWGYVLTPGGEDLETMLRRVINGEYAWGVSLWRDTHPELWNHWRKSSTTALELHVL